MKQTIKISEQIIPIDGIQLSAMRCYVPKKKYENKTTPTCKLQIYRDVLVPLVQKKT